MKQNAPWYLGIAKNDNITDKEIDEIIKSLEKLPWQLINATRLEIALYQYRVRPIRAAKGEGWSKWTDIDEKTYKHYKEEPFDRDWQFEVRVLYEKVDNSQPMIVKDCAFINNSNVGIRII